MAKPKAISRKALPKAKLAAPPRKIPGKSAVEESTLVPTDLKPAKNRAGFKSHELDHFRQALLEKRRELVGDVGQMEQEARGGRSQLAAQRLGLYADRAVICLRRSLEEMLPEERRTSFWRNQVRLDPLLAPIRKERGYLLLAGQYGQRGD